MHLLVLDLDETLLRSLPLSSPSAEVERAFGGARVFAHGGYVTGYRPGLAGFLRAAGARYRLAVWSAGAAWALHERNADTVRWCRGGGRFAVVWNGQPGGTGGTVRRIEAAGVPVRNYWESWARFSGVAGA